MYLSKKSVFLSNYILDEQVNRSQPNSSLKVKSKPLRVYISQTEYPARPRPGEKGSCLPSRLRCDGALPQSRSSCYSGTPVPGPRPGGLARLFRFRKSSSLGSDRYGHFRGDGGSVGQHGAPLCPRWVVCRMARLLKVIICSWTCPHRKSTALNVNTAGLQPCTRRQPGI